MAKRNGKAGGPPIILLGEKTEWSECRTIGLDAESTPDIPVGENEERKYDFVDVVEFLKRIGWYGKQVFDSPGPDEEYMEEVYDEDGVSISICQAYDYYVVCGLDEDDYRSLEEAFREWRKIK